jgi:GNAT superfamily N-acetyltransferase
MRIEFRELTPETWEDFEELFGPRGACGGCWCMWWSLSAKEYGAQKGDGNRRAMKRLVEGGKTPGILAYNGGKAVGWCAVAPRSGYVRLQRSRLLKAAPRTEENEDDTVWAVVCFYVARSHRRSGLTLALLKAATECARRRSAKVVEGYPLDVPGKDYPAMAASTGFAPTFLKAGFREVASASLTRPIMRLHVS